MTNEDSHELARRLVACKHFRWLPGMLEATGWRIAAVYPDGVTMYKPRGMGVHGNVAHNRDMGDCIPDLSDPLTCLGVLHLVRIARGHVSMHATKEGQLWHIRTRDGNLISGPNGSAFYSEAEALVAALEAAPTR